MQQRFASLSDIVNKLKETEVQGELLLWVMLPMRISTAIYAMIPLS